MKPGARLINTARGGIVDEAALYQALKAARPAAAAVDVFEQEPPGENPLFTLPNFIATPHIAASTVEAQASVAFDVAEEVAAVLAGELPRYAVNAPALPPEEMAFLRPFADLTERLASLYVQLQGGRIPALELEYALSSAPGEGGKVYPQGKTGPVRFSMHAARCAPSKSAKLSMM